MILDALTLLLVAAGVVFFVAGTVGLLRFPDSFSRLHALTKADSLGLGLIALGLLPQAADIAAGAKLVLVWLLILLGSTAAGQLLLRLQHDEETRADD